MGSLQDQLLKAGLVTEEQLEQRKQRPKPRRGKKFAKAKADGRQHRSPAGQRPRPAAGKGDAAGGDISLEAAYRARQAAEKDQQEQDKKRQQREQEARRKRNLQLDELVKDQIRNDEAADIKRYFEYADRIRHLYVTAEQLTALAEGTLGIAVLRGRYLLLEPQVLEQFKAVAPDLVPVISADDDQSGGDDAEDVPSDLRW
ncbi:MAG: hypothetical protein Tsb002_13380 [Wenzhouxiangellaceae bacterium]